MKDGKKMMDELLGLGAVPGKVDPRIKINEAVGIIGRIELSGNKSITMYSDGSGMIASSHKGLSVLLHLDPSDMLMIKDWQIS